MALRTHVVLPEDLVAEVDRLAGKRKRSQFIEEAVRYKVQLARQREALEKYAGVLKDVDIPEWSTPEKTSEWVRQMRREDDRHMVEKLRRVGVEVPLASEPTEPTTPSDERSGG